MKPKKLSLCAYLVYANIISFGVLLDQLTKWLTVRFLPLGQTLPLWEGVLHLTYVKNTGAAFGMMKDARWLFMIVSTIAILLMSAYLFLGLSGKNRLTNVSLAMIISGGIGNMIDRTFLGFVVDFIDFRLINFAVFNGADSLVCVGAGLLILSLILDIAEERREAKGKQS